MNDDIEFEYTVKEISEKLNIPKETCRQVLLVALKKLKHSNLEFVAKEICEDYTKGKNDKSIYK